MSAPQYRIDPQEPGFVQKLVDRDRPYGDGVIGAPGWDTIIETEGPVAAAFVVAALEVRDELYRAAGDLCTRQCYGANDHTMACMRRNKVLAHALLAVEAAKREGL